jgi:pimeloyl-ACP methyl ester carboxylesterase
MPDKDHNQSIQNVLLKIEGVDPAIIPDAVHFVQMEQSNIFNYTLLEFIKKNTI